MDVLRNIVITTLLATLLASCGAGSLPPEYRAELSRMEARRDAMSPVERQLYDSLWKDASALGRFLRHSTARNYDGLHGSQFEYLSADGRSFLWYPGNPRTVPGQWHVRQAGSTAQVCFRYGANSYNPVTNTRGGDWECELAEVYLINLYDLVSGDPFKLASGTVPFVLHRGSPSINDALQYKARPPINSNKVTW